MEKLGFESIPLILKFVLFSPGFSFLAPKVNGEISQDPPVFHKLFNPKLHRKTLILILVNH